MPRRQATRISPSTQSVRRCETKVVLVLVLPISVTSALELTTRGHRLAATASNGAVPFNPKCRAAAHNVCPQRTPNPNKAAWAAPIHQCRRRQAQVFLK